MFLDQVGVLEQIRGGAGRLVVATESLIDHQHNHTKVVWRRTVTVDTKDSVQSEATEATETEEVAYLA